LEIENDKNRNYGEKMEKKLRFLVIFVAFTLIVSTAPETIFAKGKPDFKPIPARNIELVKKISVKGPPFWAGGKKEKNASTGVLGELVEGNKYAIVIGISDYPGDENDLKYAEFFSRKHNTFT